MHVHRLAPELLSEIFLHCIDQSPGKLPQRRGYGAPLLFGRVCVGWRHVSLSTPELWSYFRVDGDSHVNLQDFEKDGSAMQAWLERSTTFPLSIEIRYSSAKYKNTIESVIAMVVAQSLRWRKMSLIINHNYRDMVIRPLREGQTSLLESIVIRCGPSGSSTTELTTIDLSQFPRLTMVELMRMSVRFSFSGQYSYSIRTFIFGIFTHMSVKDLILCTSHFPLLEKLSFPIGRPESSGRHAITELPHLVDCQLYVFDPADAAEFFDCVYAPALKHLEVSTRQCPRRSYRHIFSMLERCRPPLESLALDETPMLATDFLLCLREVKDLTTLWTNDVSCSDITIQALTIDDKGDVLNSNLCPRLRNMIFGMLHDVSLDMMRDMILSRWINVTESSESNRATRALRTVRIFDLRFLPLLQDPTMEECVRDGLDLRI
ncbi:hypothetical protein BD410DRAFT_505864 [Rickenella mellea]|uniref:F-box domain-containing protein n=1 Tax=Rickenella mellea TaxID=50990 RepID=A0A4Y7PRV7_9AGAM|nr:hypothetical protein BD410DRAFT_505864 [Rickenella mellea]